MEFVPLNCSQSEHSLIVQPARIALGELPNRQMFDLVNRFRDLIHRRNHRFVHPSHEKVLPPVPLDFIGSEIYLETVDLDVVRAGPFAIEWIPLTHGRTAHCAKTECCNQRTLICVDSAHFEAYSPRCRRKSLTSS